jgi:hypothetical protein
VLPVVPYSPATQGRLAKMPSRANSGFVRKGLDGFLRASWVFSYAAMIFVFRLLQRLERRSPGGVRT